MIQHIQLTLQWDRDGDIRLNTVCRFALVPSLSRVAAATVRFKMNQQCSKQLGGVRRFNCNVRGPNSERAFFGIFNFEFGFDLKFECFVFKEC